MSLSIAVGGLVGVAWRLLAPLPRLHVEQGGVFLAQGESESAVAADGWFALCAGVAGLGCAIAVFAWVKAARPGALAGLTAGGMLGALLAGRLGAALGPGPIKEAAKGRPVGAFLDGPLAITAHGVYVIWPLIAVGVYFALAAGLQVGPAAEPEAPAYPAGEPHGPPKHADRGAPPQPASPGDRSAQPWRP